MALAVSPVLAQDFQRATTSLHLEEFKTECLTRENKNKVDLIWQKEKLAHRRGGFPQQDELRKLNPEVAEIPVLSVSF